jgi:hypothetical protein
MSAPFMADHRDELPMTMKAIRLGYLAIERGDPNGLREVTSGKSTTMVPPVHPFDQIFGRKSVRSVTIVTHGNGLVAATIPAVIDLSHHVTVGASLRVIREIREPFGIGKSEAAQAHNPAQKTYQDHPRAEGEREEASRSTMGGMRHGVKTHAVHSHATFRARSLKHTIKGFERNVKRLTREKSLRPAYESGRP